MIIRNHKPPPPLKLTKEQVEKLHTSTGLGDRVEKIAKPIARAIDKVAGTKIEECDGCKARKAWLNKHFPGKA